MVSVLEENVVLEQQRMNAYRNRDMPAYASICNALGLDVEPELLDDINFGLNSEGERHLRDSLEKVQKRIDIRKRRAKMKHPEYYDNLLRIAVESGMINRYGQVVKAADARKKLENYSGIINTMRAQIVEATKYHKLNANEGEKVLIGDAKPSRIAKMYRDYIETAKEIQLD